MTSQTLHRRNFLLHLQERPAYDEPVLLKEPAHDQLTTAQIAQLHNEHIISRQLAQVPGVRSVYALEGSESHPVLLLNYIEGNSLAEIIQEKPLDLLNKLQLAVQITAILGRIHEEGVMHRDISGSNILVSDSDVPDEPGGVTIIDFGLATAMRQKELSQPVAADAIAGSLAYISPEQTGRMNRAVDYRSDLYSLGVTLYELFTGQLPFQTGDTMEMIHAHIAVQPIPPRQCNVELPETLSGIVLKLMAKNAEDRYQSTVGVGADLVRCLDQLQRTGSVESFELGQDDFSDRLHIPQKLYGRQSEIAQLVAAYDRVAQGNSELLFIAGYSGVGKTALVHEIRRDVLIKRGIFIEGKFDQLQQTLPYSAWAQAFMQLVNNWLAESETKLAGWRETILDAVGDNGQILLDIIPVLERVIGPQPPVPQLGGIENQNRLNYTFNRFISNLAMSEHPLVVFLDDLQWVDPASLNLLEALMAGQSTSSFLVIGAYRDNEVGADHPLVASQERMSGENDRVRIITLADLAPVDVDNLLADTLQLPVADCRDLSQVLVEKTAGNPFYFRQQLYALESEELLSFDRQRHRWVWEAELQQSLQAGGNVVDLMISKIQTLPVETQHTLSMAAFIGSRFKASTLDTITGRSEMDILSNLNPALQDGLIVRSNGYFIFAHDRVQEAGYSLIPQVDLPKTHLEIGRLLLADTADEDLDEELFVIVGHLNAGRDLIDAYSEKIDLAVLNLMAGQKAKAASAFSDAKTYIEIGLDLLGPDSWQGQYELTLSLHNENGELASFTGQYDQITPIADLIHANAKNFLDQIRIDMIQIEAGIALYDFDTAVEIAFNTLEKLGIEIPMQPTSDDYQRLIERLLELLTDRPMDVVPQLSEMTDERALAASSVLVTVLPATFISKTHVYPIVGFTGAILTLEYGYFPWSPHFFGQMGALMWVAKDLGNPSDQVLDSLLFTRKIHEVVLEMLQNPVFTPSRSKAYEGVCQTGVFCWTMEDAIENAQKCFQSGFEIGDLLFAGQGALLLAMYNLAAGMNLDEFGSQVIEHLQLLNRFDQSTFATYTSFFLQGGINFKETGAEPHKLIGDHFDEDAYLPAAEAANDVTGRHFFYAVKLMVVYHFDVDNELLAYINEAEKIMFSGPGLLTVAISEFYSALGRLRLYPGLTPEDQEHALYQVGRALQLMEIWSQSAPTTFQHMYDLIAAEKARVSGDLDGALSHYERAIHGAKKVGFTNDEALANELYARFWAERDNDRFASQFMREAHSLYRKWGALAKAEHLTKRYPNLMIGRSIVVDESRTGIIFDQMTGDLDFLTILKASQALAGEIELDRLLDLLMTNAIENSGAQLGHLLLQEGGQWMIVAQADLDESVPRLEQSIPVDESDLLSQGIVHYVARTQQTILLDDASQSGEFIDDPHIQRNEVKSLLCTPLVNQGKTSALLYLENNLSSDVFTSERVELLQLLSSQMAISIDNARTHDRLEQLLDERSKALSSAEAQIRALFENSPIGITLSSFEGEFLIVNEAVLNMLRISEEEILRQGAANFWVDPVDRKTLLAEVQKSGSVQDFGVQLVRSDGESFYASMNMSRLVLEGNEVLLTLVEDVTDQITAEQESAVLEERERLAHELHDAVTQTLFSASVLAQAAPRLMDKNPPVARQNVEQLALLIRGALAEMRALLFELRPTDFMEQNLSQMFDLLAESTRARTRANVTMNVDNSCSLPQNVAIILYRIAQESLNNVAKHALAGEVVVDLTCDTEGAKLTVKDDGRGFDPQAIPAGHMGVSIMRERAQKIGANIEIDGEIGMGTQVTVSWSAVGNENEYE